MSDLLPGYAATVVKVDAEVRILLAWVDQQLGYVLANVRAWEPQPCPEGDFTVIYEPVAVVTQRPWWRLV